jgi:hypothetical protein
MTVIEEYAQSVLAPQLLTLGLNKHQRAIVLEDVARRLESLLSHWSDLPFRRTVLVLGTEEASFWEPRNASLEIRSLVVVTVRNSLITDLNADRAYTAMLRARKQFLPDEQMPWITGEAINYFQALDFDHLQVLAQQDIFGSLPCRFPKAWHALSLLGNSSDHEIECQLPETEGETMDLSALQGCTPAQTVIASGIDPGIDRFLMDILSQIEQREIGALFTTSFKHITRNPVKLLSVIERILCSGGTVLSPNYLLSPTYIARRNPLLRPMHFKNEMAGQLANPIGLTQRHKAALAAMQL